MAISCLAMFLLVGLVFRIRYQSALVIGASMEPTYSTGDVLLVDTSAYREGEPVRGDIVVVRYRGEYIVKRVVGVPGEELEMQSGVLRVNGAVLPETYPVLRGPLNIGQGSLFEGRYAVVGDNRSLSADEFVYAVVGREQFVGRVTFALRLGRLSRGGRS